VEHLAARPSPDAGHVPVEAGTVTDWRACDICRVPTFDKDPVTRYGLRAYKARKSESGHWSAATRMAGSIDICQKCWDRIAKPRMVPQRAARRTAP